MAVILFNLYNYPGRWGWWWMFLPFSRVETCSKKLDVLSEMTQPCGAGCPVHTHQIPPASFTNNFCPRSSASSASSTPSPEMLRPSPPGYILLLVTDKPALGGLWFCGVDHFSQKEDALGIGGKDHHKEEPVQPKGLAVVAGPKGDRTAGDHCSLGANFTHLQDGLAEALKGK